MLYRWVDEGSLGSVSLEELVEFLEERLLQRAQVQAIEAFDGDAGSFAVIPHDVL